MHNTRLMVLLCCLAFLTAKSVTAKSNKLVGTKLAFNSYTLTAPFNVVLPVIPLDVVANNPLMDELVVIGEDEANQTWLAVYVYDESKNDFSLLDKIQLSDEYFAFDISENAQELYFLAKNKVVSLAYTDIPSENNHGQPRLSLKPLHNVNSMFLVNDSSFIAKKDFIQDINNDGSDDIILPDFEHTNVWLFNKNSQNFSAQHIAIPTQTELSGDGVSFQPTALFYADFNGDERQDIAWISQGKINYFSQNALGEFTEQPDSIALAESIYGVNWWQLREADGQSPDQSNLTHRVVEEIKDINGDGLVDVIVRYTKSSGVLDRTNDYEFYFGFYNQDRQLAFAKTANTVIKAEGTLTGLTILDVNGDDKLEVLLSSFELSVSNIIGALLSGGIDQNVLLFALNDKDSYGEDALIAKEVELNFSLTSGQSGQPIVMIADVNGDKLEDLILSSSEEKIAIYLGQNTSRLFNKKASKHEILLPKNGELFEHHDLNHDGKEDFMMRYGRLDDESMANKVTILLVK
ncbi:hypothetical protein NBRC116592_35360 [Colwellia sp. KU-HH00111]|uniref:FG-GAP repeat domain-containing protein n=1 Tax=Colwellia sp. KU-HH00111 TaxID=3127652 RepID=UPI0031074370